MMDRVKNKITFVCAEKKKKKKKKKIGAGEPLAPSHWLLLSVNCIAAWMW